MTSLNTPEGKSKQIKAAEERIKELRLAGRYEEASKLEGRLQNLVDAVMKGATVGLAYSAEDESGESFLYENKPRDFKYGVDDIVLLPKPVDENSYNPYCHFNTYKVRVLGRYTNKDSTGKDVPGYVVEDPKKHGYFLWIPEELVERTTTQMGEERSFKGGAGVGSFLLNATYWELVERGIEPTIVAEPIQNPDKIFKYKIGERIILCNFMRPPEVSQDGCESDRGGMLLEAVVEDRYTTKGKPGYVVEHSQLHDVFLWVPQRMAVECAQIVKTCKIPSDKIHGHEIMEELVKNMFKRLGREGISPKWVYQV
jgi:hypothetical protein